MSNDLPTNTRFVSKRRAKSHIVINQLQSACGLTIRILERQGWHFEDIASQPICKKCRATRDWFGHQIAIDEGGAIDISP